MKTRRTLLQSLLGTFMSILPSTLSNVPPVNLGNVALKPKGNWAGSAERNGIYRHNGATFIACNDTSIEPRRTLDQSDWMMLASDYPEFDTADEIRAIRSGLYKAVRLRGEQGGIFEYIDSQSIPENGFLINGSKSAGTIIWGESGLWRRKYTTLDPLFFGARANYSASDIPHNTNIVQHMLNALAEYSVITIPNGVYYDWGALTISDFVTIIDDSGYDARASIGTKQAYRRILARTNSSTGNTNGNTHWLTADYHPAYIAQAISGVGSDGARASFISWLGSKASPHQYGAQWTQDFTSANKIIAVAGYDNTAQTDVGTRLSVIRHPADAENSGAHGFGGIPTAGSSYEFFMAGLSTIATYLTKSFVGRKTLPSGSTGIFDEIWQRGISILWRRQINDAGMGYVVGGSQVFLHDSNGALSAVLRKVRALTTATAALSKFDSRSIITNEDLTGGIIAKLPIAVVGLEFELMVMNGQNLRVLPEAIDMLQGWTQATTSSHKIHSAGYYIQSANIGDRIHLVCAKSGVWSYIRFGMWTDQ